MLLEKKNVILAIRLEEIEPIHVHCLGCPLSYL